MEYSAASGASDAAREVLAILTGGGHHLPYEKTDIAANPAGAVVASRVINAGDICEVIGYSFTETTGAAPAAVRLRDGANAQGEVIVRVNLLASESVRDVLTPRGVRVFTGHLFLEVITGSVEGVVYWRPQRDAAYYE